MQHTNDDNFYLKMYENISGNDTKNWTIYSIVKVKYIILYLCVRFRWRILIKFWYVNRHAYAIVKSENLMVKSWFWTTQHAFISNMKEKHVLLIGSWINYAWGIITCNLSFIPQKLPDLNVIYNWQLRWLRQSIVQFRGHEYWVRYF